jgi:hypothetical protein
MQPATVVGGAQEAGHLSQEQLQALSMAARILGKGVEEVTKDMTDYIEKLMDVEPEAKEEAIQKQFKIGPTTPQQGALLLRGRSPTGNCGGCGEVASGLEL